MQADEAPSVSVRATTTSELCPMTEAYVVMVTITDRMDYTPYGLIARRTGSTPTDTPFLFCGTLGVMTDSNGLISMRTRFYNPHLMRFVSSDTIGLDGGLNSYAYADGSPMMGVDPDGKFANFIVGALIGVGVQVAIDIYRGETSSLGSYLGAAAGGALTGGASALIRGVGTAAIVGAAGAYTANLTQQTVDIGTGQQQEFSASSLAIQTAAGGVFSAAGTKITPWMKDNLSRITKGYIGDGISTVNNLCIGTGFLDTR